MQPAYKFPRSLGSLDLTDPSTVAAPTGAGGPSGSRSHPSLLVTDSSGHAQASMSDEQYLEKFTSAANTLREGGSIAPAPGLAAPNPAHLSTGAFSRSKSLSRISEYSESAYSSGSRARDSRDPPMSPPRSEVSRSPSPGASPVDPAFGPVPASFAFPAPPPIHAAHLSPRGPPLVPVTTPTSPQPVPSQRFHVTNPDPSSPSLSTSPIPSITRHHLPSRPLTTPLPLENPAPVPVPLDNFAAPPTAGRAESPQWSAHSHGSSPSVTREYMVQLPGRAVLPEDAPQRFSRHGPEHSESSTAWATAEDDKYFHGDAYAGTYDAGSYDSHEGVDVAGSPNRFTLDDEKIGVGKDLQQRRKGSDATTMTATQGWEPEQEQPRKGANRRLLWAFLVLLVIGVAVGVGVGVGEKQADERHKENDSLASASAASSSSSLSSPSTASSSSSLRTIIRPTTTSPSSATASAATPAATETYSTTFGFEQSGQSTVVPLTYTIPSSYFTRDDGRYQFTEQVVLPNLGTAGGSFTSDLRFRVAPTAAAEPGAGAASVAGEVGAATRERARRWDRREREKRARVIR